MSRRIEYLTFIERGGDISKLPYPSAPEDEFLYKACLYGTGLEKARSFYSCKIDNTGSGPQNFIGGFLDLKGDIATTVKVKATVKVRQESGFEIPTKIGLRLFANNDPIREGLGGGYNTNADELVPTPAVNTTYTIEHVFTGGNLNTCRYLKPFISLSRTEGQNHKHFIEVHELLAEVNNVVYDLTDTIFNFQEGPSSDFRYMLSQIPLDAVARKRGPFFGKKLACLGDSITNGMNPEGGAALAFPWRLALRDKCGFLNVKNYGANGRRISSNVSDQIKSFINTVADMDANVDAVTVMGGINDFAQGLPLGEFKAVKPTDSAGYGTTTFYGAVQTLYEALKAKYTDIPVIVINMLNGNNGAAETNGAKFGAAKLNVTVPEGMEMYREAIRTCARHYGFPCLELQDVVGFDVFNPEDKATYVPDDLHPNQLGHNLMAEAIGNFINSLV